MTKCMSNRLVIIRSWLAVFLWMALIFYLSSQVASQSDELSRGIAEILFSYLEKIFPELNTEFINSNVFGNRKVQLLAIKSAIASTTIFTSSMNLSCGSFYL